jgi:hypothetical protein
MFVGANPFVTLAKLSKIVKAAFITSQRQLPYLGNIFSKFQAHLTRSFSWSDISKYGIHLAVIRLTFK